MDGPSSFATSAERKSPTVFGHMSQQFWAQTVNTVVECILNDKVERVALDFSVNNFDRFPIFGITLLVAIDKSSTDPV